MTYHLVAVSIASWQGAALLREKKKIEKLLGNRQFFIESKFFGIEFWSDEEFLSMEKCGIDSYLNAARKARRSLLKVLNCFKYSETPIFLLADEGFGIDESSICVFGRILPDNESMNWVKDFEFSLTESNQISPKKIWGKISGFELTLNSMGFHNRNVVYKGSLDDVKNNIPDIPCVAIFRVVRTPMIFTRLIRALTRLENTSSLIWKKKNIPMPTDSKTFKNNPETLFWWAFDAGEADQLEPYYREIDLWRDEFVIDDSSRQNRQQRNAIKSQGPEGTLNYNGTNLSPSDFTAMVALEEILQEPIPEVIESRASVPKFGFFIESGEIVSLYLYKKNLKCLPECIGKFQNLRTLTAGSNVIPSIPSYICKLEKLVTLNLSNNCIINIPDEIGGLKHLEHLYLMANKIAQLPESIDQLVNLEYMNFSSNKITRLPEALKHLKKLKFLNIIDNPLESKYHEWIKDLQNRNIHILL